MSVYFQLILYMEIKVQTTRFPINHPFSSSCYRSPDDLKVVSRALESIRCTNVRNENKKRGKKSVMKRGFQFHRASRQKPPKLTLHPRRRRPFLSTLARLILKTKTVFIMRFRFKRIRCKSRPCSVEKKKPDIVEEHKRFGGRDSNSQTFYKIIIGRPLVRALPRFLFSFSLSFNKTLNAKASLRRVFSKHTFSLQQHFKRVFSQFSSNQKISFQHFFFLFAF